MVTRARALVLATILALPIAGPMAQPAAAEPVQALRVAAASGDASAQMRLGDAHASGTIGAVNPAQAFAWHLRAARQGHAPAFRPVASAYHDGRGVARDLERALWWFGRAAEAGDATAQNEVAYHHAQEGRDLDGALAMVDRALASQPANPHFLDTRAFILERRGQHREAAELLRKAHALAPGDAELTAHLARAERRRK